MAEFDPAEILARVHATYAACRAYRDTGEVVTRYESLDGRHIHRDRKPFTTAFVRPERLRFEYWEPERAPEDEWTRLIVLWNEEGVRSNWTLEQDTCRHGAVYEALEAAQGVSDGSSWTVPALLLGFTERRPLPLPEEVLACELGALGERECFLLRVHAREGESETLWICRREFLLLRIDDTQMFDEERLSGSRAFRTESTTTYSPALDVPIEARVFAAPAAWNQPPAPVVFVPRRATVRVSAEAGLSAAAEILARVRATYAGCSALRDSGTVTEVSLSPDNPGGKRTQVRRFTLAYRRPDRLRFEYECAGDESEEVGRFLLTLGSETGLRRGFVDGLPHEATRESVADLARTYVPLCLLQAGFPAPDPLPSLDSAELVGCDVLNGHECLVLRGRPPGRPESTFWIGRADFLVRRCELALEHGEAERVETRGRLEKELGMAPTEEHRSAIQQLLVRLSEPALPYRSEHALDLAPELDPELPTDAFMPPEAWRGS